VRSIPRASIGMSFLSELKAKKQSLKSCETVVRPHPCVAAGTEEFGDQWLCGERLEEIVEAEDVTEALAHELAAVLRPANAHSDAEAPRLVIYTGAGVSTSTGIGDYRGPKGVWTNLAEGVIPDESFDYSEARPSYTHMAIKRLVDEGIAMGVTSTNLDGLHMKSGLAPMSNLAELHGNMFCERCVRCSAENYQAFPIQRTPKRFTGRYCDCGGHFMDSGIDFGQVLPFKHLALAEKQANSQTVSLVLGTSLRVKPSCDLPLANDAAVCIVNKQETPHDGAASVRSFAACDDFMLALMTALGLEVDQPPRLVEGPGSLTATALKKRSKELSNLMAAASDAAWTEATTEDGNVYYIHTETGQTAWERPNGIAALNSEGLQLPKGWSAHHDPVTGVTFYYCAAKGHLVNHVHPYFGQMYDESYYEDAAADGGLGAAAGGAGAAAAEPPAFMAELLATRTGVDCCC